MSPARPGVLRSVHRRERGTIILLAAVTIVVIVGMLALAVDLGYLMSGKGQLQNALDATALAAVQGPHAAIEPPGIHIQQSTLVRSIARVACNHDCVWVGLVRTAVRPQGRDDCRARA